MRRVRAAIDEIELLAELLSLPSSAAELNLSPQRKREMLFEALLHQLEAVARSRPVLMVFEDAHWIDPTSRELLDLTVDRVSTRCPSCSSSPSAPSFSTAWSGQPHVTTLSLNRLGGHDGAALVERLAGDAGLARETVDEIVERADGVPLFVEELTKAVLETSDRAHWRQAPLPSSRSRPTLHASLIARLDRLGPIAKEVGQIGAVLGREFGYDLIEAVAQRPAAELRSGSTGSPRPGCCSAAGSRRNPPICSSTRWCRMPPTAPCCVHGARNCTPVSRRCWKQHFADLVERQPELLAHHLTAAGDTERAVDQWLKAGQHAAERFGPSRSDPPFRARPFYTGGVS